MSHGSELNNRPALNVVVYSSRGPADGDIERHAARFVEAKSVVPLGGQLGYLVLVPTDFDRLWGGVESGDAIGAAANVLKFLDPDAQQFAWRTDLFVYGWIGDDNTDHGRMLLMQVVPREAPPRHRPSVN